MRLTPLGKLLTIILLTGFGIGAWRLWQQKSGSSFSTGTDAEKQARSTRNNEGGLSGWVKKMLPGGSSTTGSGSSGTTGSDIGDNGPTTSGPGEILLVTSKTKQGWLQDQIALFNEQNQGKYKVTIHFDESREAMHDILDGGLKPVLWSPSSVIWASRLTEVWEKRTGNPLLDPSDPTTYRIYFHSPLVFLTTRNKLDTLRSRLGGNNSWDLLHKLSLHRNGVPWGAFKYSHADPLVANSGFMTLGLILSQYASVHGGSSSPDTLSTSSGFTQFLTETERSLVYDEPAKQGSSPLAKAFTADPSRYDMIPTYESSAMDAVAQNPDLAVFYPNPTAVTEQAATLVNGPWVTQEQRDGAMEFLKFLGSPESLQAGLKDHLRPAHASSTLSFADQIERFRPQGFQDSFSAIDLPDYTALNNAAFQWRLHVAHESP